MIETVFISAFISICICCSFGIYLCCQFNKAMKAFFEELEAIDKYNGET